MQRRDLAESLREQGIRAQESASTEAELSSQAKTQWTDQKDASLCPRLSLEIVIANQRGADQLRRAR